MGNQSTDQSLSSISRDELRHFATDMLIELASLARKTGDHELRDLLMIAEKACRELR